MARFLVFMLENEGYKKYEDLPKYSNKIISKLGNEDKKIVEKFHELTNTVNRSLEKYRFSEAAEGIYHFMWNDLASEYLEKIKVIRDKEISLGMFRYVYLNSLKLLHPFMPFVTETIWGELKSIRENPNQMLISASWPESK
jgi:valyl-tRNA synthetase